MHSPAVFRSQWVEHVQLNIILRKGTRSPADKLLGLKITLGDDGGVDGNSKLRDDNSGYNRIESALKEHGPK